MINPINVVAFSERIAQIVTERHGKRLPDGPDPEGNREVVAIGLTGFKTARCGSIEDFLQEGDARAKTLGVLGLNPIGQAVARQARSGFGMEILYHHSQPAPDIENACGARFLPLDEVLRQADLVCVILPLTREAETLLYRRQCAPLHSPAIFLAWQRSRPIERAIAHLSAHYAEPIHLDELATVAGLSKFHLVRLFSTTLGIAPHRYQLLLRVSQAKAMLRRGDKIGEVAFRVGFADQSHFHRYFRLIFGLTPGQYQKGSLAERQCELAQERQPGVRPWLGGETVASNA